MSVIPISYYLVLSAILFGLGAVGVVFKRNIITIFMSIELMLNAVNLAFVAFARAHGQIDGLVFVFFVIVVAAAEAAVGLAIVIMITQQSPVAQRRARQPAQVLMPILDHLWIIHGAAACRRGDQRASRQELVRSPSSIPSPSARCRSPFSRCSS